MEESVLEVERKLWQTRVLLELTTSAEGKPPGSQGTPATSPNLKPVDSMTSAALVVRPLPPLRSSTTHLVCIMCLGDVGWSAQDDSCFPVFGWLHPKAQAEGSNRAIEMIGRQIRSQYEVFKTAAPQFLGKDVGNPSADECRDCLRSARRDASPQIPTPLNNRVL
eukprot:PhF_6_TR10556/c0_g1_i1/m.16780